MSDVNKYHWMNWIAKMLSYIRQGDLAKTANILACCLLPEDATDVDRWGAKKMFGHTALVGKHAELWALMKPMVTPEYIVEVSGDLQNYGWAIRKEEPETITEMLARGVVFEPFDPATGTEEVD